MTMYKGKVPDDYSDDENVECDRCGELKIQDGEYYFDCKECGYDICKNCATTLGKYNK